MSRVAHPAGPRHADVLPAEHPPTPPKDLNALNPEIWPGSARRAAGVLTVGGLDVRDLAAEDYRTRYLRPRGRDLPVFELERTAVAQVR